MENILKWLGLAPAVEGVLANYLGSELMEKLDLLNGYRGGAPHIVGGLLFVVALKAAKRWNDGAPDATAQRRRRRFALAALVLICVNALIWLFPLPNTWPQWLILNIGPIATLIYLAFYVSLGLSEPET